MLQNPAPVPKSKKLIKTSTIALLVVFVIILAFVSIEIYSWQHKKVTTLQNQVKTLNTQLQYVQQQQDALERQLQ